MRHNLSSCFVQTLRTLDNVVHFPGCERLIMVYCNTLGVAVGAGAESFFVFLETSTWFSYKLVYLSCQLL